MGDGESSKSYREKWKQSFRDNLSEWLRRQTRNLLGNARASSNPAVVVFIQTMSICFILRFGVSGLHNHWNEEYFANMNYFRVGV